MDKQKVAPVVVDAAGWKAVVTAARTAVYWAVSREQKKTATTADRTVDPLAVQGLHGKGSTALLSRLT